MVPAATILAAPVSDEREEKITQRLTSLPQFLVGNFEDPIAIRRVVMVIEPVRSEMLFQQAGHLR
jgi:hypothetical protein